jgi:uncharacterized membrane protein YccC
MFFNVPGGLLNTDGVPLLVAPGPEWMNTILGVAAVAVFVVLAIVLAQGRRRRRRAGRPLRRFRPLAPLRSAA